MLHPLVVEEVIGSILIAKDILPTVTNLDARHWFKEVSGMPLPKQAQIITIYTVCFILWELFWK